MYIFSEKMDKKCEELDKMYNLANVSLKNLWLNEFFRHYY